GRSPESADEFKVRLVTCDPDIMQSNDMRAFVVRENKKGPHGAFVRIDAKSREPQVGIEPTTARLRIECSTTELLWHSPLRGDCHSRGHCGLRRRPSSSLI